MEVHLFIVMMVAIICLGVGYALGEQGFFKIWLALIMWLVVAATYIFVWRLLE